MAIKVTSNVAEKCECGRLYKDRRDADGKMMCAACYLGCSVEDLAKFWGMPVKKREARNEHE